MRLTTLCYLEQDGCYLMLHRTKKKEDLNEGKWIGVGGKLEPGESPEDCARREIREETGLTVQELRFRAVITFLSDRWKDEVMYLFTSGKFSGELKECDEGDLAWVPIDEVMALPGWEGDAIFLRKLQESDTEFFSLKLDYAGDDLRHAVLWEEGRETILR